MNKDDERVNRRDILSVAVHSDAHKHKLSKTVTSAENTTLPQKRTQYLISGIIRSLLSVMICRGFSTRISINWSIVYSISLHVHLR